MDIATMEWADPHHVWYIRFKVPKDLLWFFVLVFSAWRAYSDRPTLGDGNRWVWGVGGSIIPGGLAQSLRGVYGLYALLGSYVWLCTVGCKTSFPANPLQEFYSASSSKCTYEGDLISHFYSKGVPKALEVEFLSLFVL